MISFMKRLMTIFTLRCSEPGCSVSAVGGSEAECRSKMFGHLLTEHNRMVPSNELRMPEQKQIEVPVVPRMLQAPRAPAGQMVMSLATVPRDEF